MRKSQQSTLFQTWGHCRKQKQQKEVKTNSHLEKSIAHQQIQKKKDRRNRETASAKPSNTEDHGHDVINLVDFDDDLDLLQCVETTEQNSTNKNTTSTNDHKTIEASSNNCQEKDVFLDNQHCKQRSQEMIEGFDASFGTTYIYPTNYPIRDYQFNIIRKAILKNTLVVLPTGLGKTFIAAVVVYNFYRWYPQRKLIFMAPTKPLVAQQIEACHNIMGIPQKDTIEMTGALAPHKRQLLWQSRRVFFMTPQVLQNDLDRGICSALDIVCLVFDEAHKALGNHSYSQVIKEVVKHHTQFRVLALSATPGSDMKAVQEVVNNLLISHVELRSEDSIDIQQYVHDRKVEKIIVPLCADIKEARETFMELLQTVIIRLHNKKAIWQNDASRVSKFLVLKAREQWRADNACQDKNFKGSIEGDFALLMSLCHALDLLIQHGFLSFYNFLKGVLGGHKGSSRSKIEMSRNPKFMVLMEDLHTKIEGDESGNQSLNETIMAEKAMTPKQRLLKSIPKTLKSFSSHPKIKKLEEIVVAHFKKFQEKNQNCQTSSSQTPNNTRIMIFSQFRDSVQEITAILSRHEPLVKVMSFIGQGSKEGANKKNNRGLSQREQLEILRRFRTGGFNTVVSTCVGEEGLDIGEVDLIVCFDASSSPIRLVQRMGRTGRNRSGRIVILVGEGKEESIYKRSLNNKKGIHKNLINASRSLDLYEESPRLIPKHLNPKCYKMNIVVESYQSKETKTSSKKKQTSSTSTKTTTNNKNKEDSISTSSINTIKRFTEKGLLNENETEYLKNHFQGDQTCCKNCQKRQRENVTCSNSNNRKSYCYHTNHNKPLSLSAWLSWQSSTQSSSHSKRTSMFCSVMETAARFRSATEVEEYEKWLSSKFKEEDVVDTMNGNKTEKNISRKSDNSNSNINSKHKKEQTPRQQKLTGKDWRINMNGRTRHGAILSDDDDISDIDDFSEKLDKIVHKNNSKLNDEEDKKYKPCSLEEMIEKQEEKLSTQRKKRVRVTRLPKPPKIDLDLSDIEDRQIGFCSQVSMETLYNRCQKRKRDQLRPLHENEPLDSDNNIESDPDIEPALKKTKYSQNKQFISDDDVENAENDKLLLNLFKDDIATPDDQHNTDFHSRLSKNTTEKSPCKDFPLNSGKEDGVVVAKDDHNLLTENNDIQKQRQEDKQNLDILNEERDPVTCSTANERKEVDIFLTHDQEHGMTESQAISGMFPMCTPTKIRRHKDDGNTIERDTKTIDLLIPDAVPEAPSDIELGSFLLFDSSFPPVDKEVTETCVELSSKKDDKHPSISLVPSKTIGEQMDINEKDSGIGESSHCAYTINRNHSNDASTLNIYQEQKANKTMGAIVIANSNNNKNLTALKNKTSDHDILGLNIHKPFPNHNMIEVDIDLVGDNLANCFGDYDDVEDVNDETDDMESSPPIVTQRKLPMQRIKSRSPVTKRTFNFNVPDFDENCDEGVRITENPKKKDFVNVDSDFLSCGDFFQDVLLNDDNKYNKKCLRNDKHSGANADVNGHRRTSTNAERILSNNNAATASNKKICDESKGGKPSESCHNIDDDDGEDEDEDSPIFLKPKRDTARNTNRLIVDSQITPQSDVKVPAMKRPNSNFDDDNDLVFTKPKPSKFIGQKKQLNYDDSLMTSPVGGGDSLQGKNVKSFGESGRIKRRLSKQQKRRRAKLFIEDQCEDDGEETTLNGGDESDDNQYILDSFIDDATQPTPGSVRRYKQKVKGRSPVDMNFIYKQSLMSPQNNALHFHTPAFKVNANRYKLANLAEKYNNISPNESSEAEEIIGLIDSDEEEKQSLKEQTKRESKKKKREETMWGKQQETELANHKNERTKTNNVGSAKSINKPGKRIKKRTINLDEEETGELFDNPKQKSNESRTEEVSKKTSWCEVYTIQELPATTFSFGIDWNAVS